MGWAPDYCTPGELAEYARIGDADDDPQLRLAVAAASRAVDRTCSRQFGVTEEPVTRYYDARRPAPGGPGNGRWWVLIDDLMTEDELTVAVDDGQGVSELDNGYTLRPRNAAADGMPWTELVLPVGQAPADPVEAVALTARFGWSEIPHAVVQATLLQASRLLARRDSPFGVAGSPDQGSEMRLLARVDPDVAVSLRPYYRRWLGV